MTIKEVEVNTDFRKEIVSKIGKYYLEDLIRISTIKYGNETDESLQRAHEAVLKRSGINEYRNLIQLIHKKEDM